MSSRLFVAAHIGRVLGWIEAATALILKGSVFGRYERRTWRISRTLCTVLEDPVFGQKSKVGSTSSSQSFETHI
jgi:hypothetical protein